MGTTVLRYPLLSASLRDAPIIPKGDYGYFVHPLSDGIPRVQPELLREATAGMVEHLGPVLDDVDVLLTAEAMGLPLAASVSLATGKPFLTARKRSYGLPGERVLHQSTGYSTNTLHLNGIAPGERVAILDDVISTGGTLRALAGGLRDADAELRAVVAVFSKETDLSSLVHGLACPVSALIACRVARGRVEVLGHDLRA